jgi:hypothetical protein
MLHRGRARLHTSLHCHHHFNKWAVESGENVMPA